MDEPLVIGPEPRKARVLCMIVHGRGQSPADMVSLIQSHLVAPDVRFVLPASGGAGWYDARAVDPLTRVTRAQLAFALDRVEARFDAERAAAPTLPMIVAGFSQGACLSSEFVMRRGPWHGGLCLFTGCRIGTRNCDLPQSLLDGMAVYSSAGDMDPWIPLDAWSEMLADLARNGARTRADIFPGRGHTVTKTEIAALQAMLDDPAQPFGKLV